MNKIKGQYLFTKEGWKVRYKVENGDEQHYEDVMLHPNSQNYAKENQMDWFTIKDCPNLHNGGEYEPMAITEVSDKLEEVAEKLKGQQLFKKLNDHAMEALQEAGSIPNPETHKQPKLKEKTNKTFDMNENKTFWNWSKIIDLALIAGIVFLAAIDKDGWGWLTLVLIIKNYL